MNSRPDDVAEWLRFAREDLAQAASIAASASDVAYRHACFLAQQAAEKAIKATIIYMRGESPRWHDLESLRALVPEDWRLRGEPWQLEEPTDWAVAARYPGQAAEPAQVDALLMVKLAREVVELAASDLAAHGWVA